MRRSLSAGQKSWITKQAKKYSQIIKKPKDFTIKKPAMKATLTAMKRAGFATTHDGRIIVPSRKARVHLKGNKLTWENNSRIEETRFTTGIDTLETFRKLQKMKLRPGQAWAIRIGDNPRSHLIFGALSDLQNYVRNTTFHSADAHEHVQIVLVTAKSGRLIEQERDGDFDDED